MSTIAINRKAHHDFFILESWEAGIQLTGAEAKSAKAGHLQISDSFAKISSAGEIYLYNCYIAPYKPAADKEYQPYRARRLLLHKDQISQLIIRMRGEHITVVPIKIYTNERGLIKLELGIAQGKKKYDKRQAEKEKAVDRNIAQTLKKFK
ncbi:SsrA-binding protein SmpB [candidate division WWE3 bacterium]|nr:SsrA-binding protein SmpB [candidate division WWE3 bacterium]